jgi:hypothetical protein
LTLRIGEISALEGVFASYVVLKLQGMELEKHHSFHPDFMNEKDVRGIHLVD